MGKMGNTKRVLLVVLSIAVATPLLLICGFFIAYSDAGVNGVRGLCAAKALREEKALILKMTNDPLQYMVLKENFVNGLAEISEKYGGGKLEDYTPGSPLGSYPYAIINGIEYRWDYRAYSDHCWLITFISWDYDRDGPPPNDI